MPRHPQFQAWLDDKDYYADVIERAQAGKRGEKVETHSTNAYHVSFGEKEVEIEHMWVPDTWPTVRIPVEFIAGVKDKLKL